MLAKKLSEKEIEEKREADDRATEPYEDRTPTEPGLAPASFERMTLLPPPQSDRKGG